MAYDIRIPPRFKPQHDGSKVHTPEGDHVDKKKAAGQAPSRLGNRIATPEGNNLRTLVNGASKAAKRITDQ